MEKILRLRLRLEEPTRLDKAAQAALRRHGITIPRARLKEHFGEGRIRLEGLPRPGSWMVPPGEHGLEYLDPPGARETGPARPSARGAFLEAIYEDEDLLILHKLSGTPSVPHAASETETAVGAALARVPGLAGVGRKPLEPGLLHRLDTGTSGCLVFAKSGAEFERLLAAWRAGEVRKHYRAIVERAPPLGTQRLTLGHDPRTARRMIVLPEGAPASRVRGRPVPAVTHLVRMHGARDVEIEIETGAMHQIRCTLAHLGSPVRGDAVYGGVEASRLWLHAWRIELPLSIGARLAVEARLPDGWPAHGN